MRIAPACVGVDGVRTFKAKGGARSSADALPPLPSLTLLLTASARPSSATSPAPPLACVAWPSGAPQWSPRTGQDSRAASLSRSRPPNQNPRLGRDFFVSTSFTKGAQRAFEPSDVGWFIGPLLEQVVDESPRRGHPEAGKIPLRVLCEILDERWHPLAVVPQQLKHRREGFKFGVSCLFRGFVVGNNGHFWSFRFVGLSGEAAPERQGVNGFELLRRRSRGRWSGVQVACDR